jgi:hypothetical protein
MSVYAKLNEARKRFHSLELKKSGFNKFAGYSYFELADFLIPALRIFDEVGLCAVISFDKEMARMDIHDTSGADGVKSLTITSPLGSAALKGCHEIQNIGACETYCRRYLWVAALEIVEHDALDATTGKEQKDRTGAPVNHAVSPTKEAWDRLQHEDQLRIRKIAESVVKQPDAAAMVSVLDGANLEQDEKAALWYLLDSKTRSAIKAAQKGE